VLIIICLYFTTSVVANNSDHSYKNEEEACMDCITAPIIVCPSTYFGCPTDNIDPINTGFPAAMSGDTNCPTPIVSYTDVFVTNTPCLKVIHRTWLAEYPPGSANVKLHSQCQQTLVLEDLEAPVIENCPSDITVDLASNCDSIATWNIPTAIDDCGIQYFITTHYSGTVFPFGTTPVTYTAQDWCGQQETCSFNVTVEGSCCSSIAINCPQARTVCVGGDTSPNNTGFATAITNDISCPNPMLTYADSIITSGPCVGASLFQRTWTATDTLDNTITANCTQLISVSDLQFPTITNIPTDITVTGTGSSCNVPVTWTAPTVFDNCGIATFDANYQSGDLFSEGSTLVIYTATDNCGNSIQAAFLVNVACEAASCSSVPNIICPNAYASCPSIGNPDPSVSGYAVAFPGDVDCNQPNLIYSDMLTSVGPCSDAKTIDRTFTATDPNNSSLSASCVQSITLSDSSVPVIENMPTDITVSGSGSGCSVPVNWTAPTASDNCGIAGLTSNYANGGLFPSGTTMVIYTATDNCGSTSTASFIITVDCSSQCNALPVINCPSNYVSCPSPNAPSPTTSGFATTLPGSVDCNQPILSFIDNVVSNGSCPGVQTINRTWIATDPNNTSLTVNCVQNISLEDNVLPVITNIPSDITVTGNNSGCSLPVTWNLPTASDNCGIASLNSNYPNGNVFNEGTTVVIYTATDNCGSSATASFMVTVECVDQCTALPTITCPSNYISCPSLTTPNPAVSGYAITFPGSVDCNQPILTFIDNVVSTGSCSGSMTIERNWISTDPDNTNLNVNCLQTITLEDNEAPIISNVPSDFTVNGFGNSCLIPVSWNTPNFSDNCGISNSTSNYTSGSFFSEGVTTVIYTTTDNCGQTATASFDITVNCFSSCASTPIITGPQNYWTCPSAGVPGPDISGWATAVPGSSDCADPLITYSDATVSSGSCLGADIIERTWLATDPSNPSLYATYVQVISLEDFNPPSFVYCPSAISVNANNASCTAPAIWQAVTATDNCSLPDLDAVDQNGNNVSSGSDFYEGLNTVTYTATDLCGNTATCVFNVTVTCAPSCNSAPIITGPQNYWACPGSGIPGPDVSGWATAVAGSSYCSTPVITYNDVTIYSGVCVGADVVERTWVATDPSNSALFATHIQVISLEDFNPPSFVYCPSDITVNANNTSCATPVTWQAVTATDNCSLPNLHAVDQYGNSVVNGNVFNEGFNTVTFTATDLCGNTANCEFDITVTCTPSCNTAPSITCPSDKVICPGSSSSASILGWAIAYAGSNCPTPSVNYQDIITSTGPCNGEKVINRTWTASYSSGSNLTSSCVQIISAKDDIEPTFTSCPTDITIDNNTVVVNWTAPSATDFCSVPSVTSTHQPGSYFPLGTTTVIYTATDYCGNVEYCSFDVTVLNDNTATIACPDDIYLTCDASGGAVADWSAPLYEGTCSNCNPGDSIAGFVYMGTFNGNQYYCSTSTATWPQAQQICNSNGGYLASINDAEENQFLADILTLQSAWIGLSDAAYEGDFGWDNGDPLTYTNWYANQPNNYNNNQDYVEMLNNGLWNDQYNHYALEFIMEVPCTYIKQTAGPLPGTFLTGGRYTVSYTLSDACGANSTCSFEIVVDGGLSITCPDDINVSAQANSTGVTVKWEEPDAFSCCSNCNDSAGAPIQGFVYMGAFGGHHYYCSTQTASWENAKTTCENNGGNLAVINDQDENTFLASLLTTQSAWIGLSDIDTEGNFEWVNGDNLNFTNWYPGQPNNYNNNQDYVELLNTGQWNDQYNTYNLEYIMELPGCLNVTQIDGPISGTLLAPGTNHVVTYLATDGCGNSETCSFEINVASIPTNTTYCESYGEDSQEFYIDSVVLGTLNNQSGDNSGYGDFTAKCYNIEQNTSYDLQLNPSRAGQPDDKIYWKVWIDFNQDGDFEDIDEYVAYGCGTDILSGTIVMPAILAPGETRMRVIMKPGEYATGPCEIYQLGETEDYCLSIWGTGTLTSSYILNSRAGVVHNNLVHLETSIKDFDVSIYPNPAVDFININLNEIKNVEAIRIINGQGMILKSLDVNDIQFENKINVSTLNSGMYFISVVNNNGHQVTKKIMIQK